VNRSPAGFEVSIIVDDHETSWNHFVVQRIQGVHRRLIQISVQPQQRKLVDRGLWQGVAEPTLEESNLPIK
jgi:hypothetical protein